jgi:uncharacterized RDD family membrane protein YckC
MTDGLSPLPHRARPYQGQRAGVVTRLVASTIDAVVVAAAQLLGYAVFAGLVFLVDPRRFRFPDLSLIFSLTVAFAVLVVYLTASWSITGRTYGSAVMGLQVVNRRGEKLRLAAALVRALACAVFPIGLLWCAVSPQNHSVQDVLLRTSVIYRWQSAEASRSGSPAPSRPAPRSSRHHRG